MTNSSPSLPSRPSLQLLSNIAKALQKAHEAGNPEANARFKAAHPRFRSWSSERIARTPVTLRDAQLVIAREYGFEHWADMKKHVLSRAQSSAPEAKIQELISAALQGDPKRIATILDEHPSIIDALGGEGNRTALHFASERGHLAAVELLLNCGADPTIRDVGDNATALHFAAEKGSLDIVKLLVEYGADVDGFGDLHGWDVLGWATLHEQVHLDVAHYLLKNGAKHNVFTAVAMGDVNAIRALASVSRDVMDKPMAVWESRRRPLHLAVMKEQPEAALVLLELGADIEATDIDDITALDLAALKDSREIAQILLQHGAKVNLPAAFGLRNLTMADEIISRDPEVLKPGHRWGELISIASSHSPADVLESIIARGASVGLRVNSRAFGTKHYTPLHDAAWAGNLEAIDVLVRHGGDLNARDDTYQGTPMGWAHYANRTQAVELFQSLGASF